LTQFKQVFLEQVAAGSSLRCRRAPVLIVVLRDDDNLRVREGRAQATGRFQSLIL